MSAECRAAWVQLPWCASGTDKYVSHDFTWRQAKLCSAVDRAWKPRCLANLGEPKTTDHFTVSAYRENNYSNPICRAAGFEKCREVDSVTTSSFSKSLLDFFSERRDSDVTSAALIIFRLFCDTHESGQQHGSFLKNKTMLLHNYNVTSS